MKNHILIATLAMLTGTIVLIPLNAQAQSKPEQNSLVQDQKQNEFLETWHGACSKGDAANAEKCCQLSNEMIEKFPNLDKRYIDYAKKTIEKCTFNKAAENVYTAVNAFYASQPDASKLDALLTSGDEYLKLDQDAQSPFHLFIVAQQAEAGHRSVKAGVYKNLDRMKTYAERALKEFETLNPPEKDKKAYAEYGLFNLRDMVMANMNQYLGYYLIETKGDQPEAQDQALAYLDKSIQVKSKDSKEFIGWKDPNNYSLRRSIYSNRLMGLNKKYDALTVEQKTGDMGKELLEQINQVLDTKLIPELARMIASATNPAFKDMKSDATEEFNNFWKFRVDDPSKAPAYLGSFDADPTVVGPSVPAKPDDGTGAGATAPKVTGAGTKLSTGTGAVPGTGTGKTGVKATGKSSTKGKTINKSGGRKR
jgi:tetratricopeptide (TPR) repeat protein